MESHGKSLLIKGNTAFKASYVQEVCNNNSVAEDGDVMSWWTWRRYHTAMTVMSNVTSLDLCPVSRRSLVARRLRSKSRDRCKVASFVTTLACPVAAAAAAAALHRRRAMSTDHHRNAVIDCRELQFSVGRDDRTPRAWHAVRGSIHDDESESCHVYAWLCCLTVHIDKIGADETRKRKQSIEALGHQAATAFDIHTYLKPQVTVEVKVYILV